mmetsp:Transcript_76155/g.149403  ORF Transcript_76155/g.149403 Transcript_76155/m.149403 type:complete len:227 (+) Transcript_76155:237-917(+)
MFIVHLLFCIFLLEERFLGKSLCLFDAVRHDNIIKQCSCLYLPNLETNVRAPILANLVHIGIIFVIRIRDHRVYPLALVVGIVNLFLLPFALVFWVIKHRRFPLAIIFIIPIIRFCGFGVRNLSRNIVPSFRLLILRIRDFCLVHPVGWLGRFGVLDFLVRQKIKMFIKSPLTYGLIVDEDLKSVVWVQNQSVQMSQVVRFSGDLFFNEKVVFLLVVVENDMSLLV